MATFTDLLANLRDYPVQVGELVEAFRMATIQVDLDPSLSVGGKTEKINQISQRYMAEVDRLEVAAASDKEAVEKLIAQSAMGKAEGDPAAELARQIKYQRVWERTKALFDTYTDAQALYRGLSDLVQQAAEGHDLDTLNVLLEEAPTYLTARRMASLWDAISPAVRAALVAHASPAERRALQAKQELEVGWPRLAAAFSEAKRAIQQRATIGVLPAWSPSEHIVLDLPKTISKP